MDIEDDEDELEGGTTADEVLEDVAPSKNSPAETEEEDEVNADEVVVTVAKVVAGVVGFGGKSSVVVPSMNSVTVSVTQTTSYSVLR